MQFKPYWERSLDIEQLCVTPSWAASINAPGSLRPCGALGKRSSLRRARCSPRTTCSQDVLPRLVRQNGVVWGGDVHNVATLGRIPTFQEHLFHTSAGMWVFTMVILRTSFRLDRCH